MVFYHSFRETAFSREFCRGGRDSQRFRYRDCSPIRTGFTETLNIEDQLEKNLEAIPWKSFTGKKFESFQRQTDFQAQTRPSAKSWSNATAPLTKLNPNADPFIPKPIEWEKLPLSPLDLSLPQSFDLDFIERRDRSPIDEVANFHSSDVLFMQPYPMDVSIQKTRAFSFQEYEPRDWQQISGVDRHLFQDSAIVDSHDMIHNFPNARENMNYTEMKCYHCGCVGHMAVESYIKKQHKAAKCEKTPKNEEFGIVGAESPVLYKSDCLNQDTTLKDVQLSLEK